MPEVELTDEVLMTRVKGGDDAAFQALVKRYKNRIIGFVYRTVNSRELAEDIAQEAFLRVFTKSHTFRDGAKFSPWLYRIATNLAINELRRRKRVRFISLERPIRMQDGDELVRDVEDETGRAPDALAEQQEMRVEIARAIADLPIKYRVAFVLRDIQGHSYDAIAEMVGVPLGTIKSRVNRARSRFRDLMQPYMEAEG
jgi:RNA polymerase sigma-70 factor (ECF subfamily)